jgi:hypothetical protein
LVYVTASVLTIIPAGRGPVGAEAELAPESVEAR